MKIDFKITGDWFAGVVTAVVAILCIWGAVDILVSLYKVMW